MHRRENKIIPTYSNIPKWFVYRDNFLLPYKDMAHELSSFEANMNETRSFLKFSMEISETEVTQFLDHKIIEGDKFQSLTLKSIQSPLNLFNTSYVILPTCHLQRCHKGLKY